MADLTTLLFISAMYFIGLFTGFFSARAIYKRRLKHFYTDLANDKKYNRSIA